MNSKNQINLNCSKYLNELNQRLKKGNTALLTKDGRIYYQNHETKLSSWLPPIDFWNGGDPSLPYGWEIAKDSDRKIYYINHINKTTTYEDPRKDDNEPPPQPREVELIRDPAKGFGFVAGSEKPVIVRFVKEGSASENKLLPGDQILKVNGEDMRKAPRDKIIDLVKSCKHSVRLTVCQPYNNNTTRKSALLTVAKKAKLKSNPSRVRFAEGVAINGSPLYCFSPFELCVPFIPNVLKVFLENGQTKTFKYDNSTTIQDVLDSLFEKLSIKCPQYYSLCTEHIKPIKKNKFTLLDSKTTLSKIAARPGAHNLRCLFRMAFVPKDINELLKKDLVSFEYLYNQCCNDIVQERFALKLKYEIVLKLGALSLHEHALSNGLVNNNGKINLKVIEKEYGLEPFVPYSLLEAMKRKELQKFLNHFIKENQQLCPSGQKYLNALQTKTHYLKIISELPSYGSKMYSTNIRDSFIESTLLLSPEFGISHMSHGIMRQSVPMTLARIEDVTSVTVTKDDELCCTVEIQVKDSSNSFENSPLYFGLDEKDTEDFILVLKGYHRLFHLNQDKKYKEISVFWDVGESWWTDSAPSYHGQHLVKAAPWSYIPSSTNLDEFKKIDLSVPPPCYMPCDVFPSIFNYYSHNNSNLISNVDHNMNNTSISTVNDENYLDFHSIVSMEILESQKDEQMETVRNEDVVNRVIGMKKIISEAENYLAEEGKIKTNNNNFSSNISSNSNNNSDKVNHNSNEEEDNCEHPKLKAADSLLLLTQIDENSCFNNDKNIENDIIVDISPCESDVDADSLIVTNETLPSTEVYSSNEDEFTSNLTKKLPKLVGKQSPNRSGTSFGLHSSDFIPSLNHSDSNLLATLKHLQNNGEYQLPFVDTPIYLDPDIIDLTIIPPPVAPDTIMNEITRPFSIEEPPTFYSQNFNLSIHSQNSETKNLCCDILDTQVQSNLKPNIDTESLQPFSKNLDEFIASNTIPPPPVDSNSNLIYSDSNKKEQSDCDYFNSLIIPPPPCSNQLNQQQNEIIARFWKATDTIKKICSKNETILKPISRDVHSSSSADSGYDSVINSLKKNEWSFYCNKNNYFSTFKENSKNVDDSQKFVFLHGLNSYSNSKQISESCSCNDLEVFKPNQNLNNSKSQIARSQSLSSIERNDKPLGKPPLPPYSLSRLEKKKTKPFKNSKLFDGKNENLKSKLAQFPIIDTSISKTVFKSSNKLESFLIINKKCNNWDIIDKIEKDDIFSQAQKDIDILLARLEDAHEVRLQNHSMYNCTDIEKYMTAKEELNTESRQFVTSSKLFVKYATEVSPMMIDHLFECVTLLERMFDIAETVMVYLSSQAHITCLVDRLKEIAATYAYTVDTIHKLTDNANDADAASSPYMTLLMNHATSLATSLSALNRTLQTLP